MPHAALCVSRQNSLAIEYGRVVGFNAARSIVCVETTLRLSSQITSTAFQCRTQHCVCRDTAAAFVMLLALGVSMPHAALCVSRRTTELTSATRFAVSMPHAALCVSRPTSRPSTFFRVLFQCRTQHCVCRDTVSRSPCPARAEKAFWKDALFCAVFCVCG